MTQRYTPLVNGEGRAQLYASPDGAFVTHDDHVRAVDAAREHAVRECIAMVEALSEPHSGGGEWDDAISAAVVNLSALLPGSSNEQAGVNQ